ncbi:MAG: histidinol-phosphate transaminase [Bacteroidota bacterium]
MPEKLIRPNILALKPYSSARDEFNGKTGIYLDANENPFGNLNRYPDPYQNALKDKLSSIKNIDLENIFVGNGSDEAIDLAFRIFCNPAEDKVIVCPPTYGMYEVSANINEIEIISIPLDDNFQLNVKDILDTDAKMIFLCSPNNPTGNSLDNLETIIQKFNGIVFVDEAYIDFSKQESLLRKVNEYPNLIVSQTLSKAWGKAAIRVGIAYASKEIISYYNKVKPPYNVSQLNQYEAIKTLEETDVFTKNKQSILSQRTRLIEHLSEMNFVEKIYPTDANFILVKTKNANAIYQKLIDEKIIVRNRHSVIENCLRITVGEPFENIKLLESLKKIKL